MREALNIDMFIFCSISRIETDTFPFHQVFILFIFSCLILIELEGKQTPPDRLQMAEIAELAERISNKWVKLAYLTNKFESHEINNIKFSRCGEDESSKALDMLTKYSERGGTRQKLANKLKKLGMTSLSQDVINGCFIDDDD